MEIEFCDYVTFVFFAFNYFIYNRAFAYGRVYMLLVFGIVRRRTILGRTRFVGFIIAQHCRNRLERAPVRCT